MADLAPLLEDLAAECADLDGLVAGLDDEEWRRATPALGWTVAHQIAHLAWTDEAALLAATDPDAFADQYLREALAASERGENPVDRAAEEGAAQTPARIRERWLHSGEALREALVGCAAAGRRLPWFGPPMSAASMATARLMETWAHGEDVADALGVTRTPTGRLRNVAHLGVRTRDFAFVVNGLEPPAEPFRVELAGPDGDTWTWGDKDAVQRVQGPALDFCLLVTRRRHVADLAVVAEGEDARRWLGIAQAFAGPPGQAREPRTGTTPNDTSPNGNPGTAGA